ncbi:MAG: hypothetical protein AAGK71_03970 [Pseudomonadota bacterium]
MNTDTSNTNILIFRLAIAVFVLFGTAMMLKFNRLNCPDTYILGRSLSRRTRQSILLGVLVGVPVFMLMDHRVGLLLFAVILFNTMARSMLRMLSEAARDYNAARTLFGKISGGLGWSRTARVASGAVPLELEFELLLLMSATLGLFLSVALGVIPFG